MTDLGRKAIRRSRKQERRRNRRHPRQHRVAAGVVALATVAAVGAGSAMGPGQAQAVGVDEIISGVVSDVLGGSSGLGQLGDLKDGLMEVVNGGGADIAGQWRIQLCGSGGVNGGADCSGSSGVGLAIVAPGRIELVPASAWGAASRIYNFFDAVDNALPTGLQTVPTLRSPEDPVGNATIVGSGFQFAFASTGGEATAISYLPVSLATAGASDGRKAYAFAIVGMANAWTTTDDITTSLVGLPLPITLPGTTHISCFGGLTGAYAEGVGACANILGTFDFRWTAPDGEVQFALTDPTGVLFDPATVLGSVITAVITDISGDGNLPITLAKDFGRLSFGGEYDLFSGNFVRFTSDYGSQGATTIEWLGQKLTLNPVVTVNGQERPNHLGVPLLELGDLDTDEVVPVVSAPEVALPFGLPSPSGDRVSTSVQAAATPAEFAPPVSESSTGTSASVTTGDTEAVVDSSAPESSTPESSTTGSSGAGTRTDNADPATSYVGRHRADTVDSADTASDASPAGGAADPDTTSSGSRSTTSTGGRSATSDGSAADSSSSADSSTSTSSSSGSEGDS
ncbi:hypothetical protein [Gordonia hankookensis]|uniref:PE-PGRS family protein n=1 Tax=Gordonia hankookensis TaxID=589403 RepID=A0ABR7W814_9ACTN|nr:hypothetical protein [Gordonia hankookensis]MBD1318918.1 hypothetical protein [Gordonia hankookensis]